MSAEQAYTGTGTGTGTHTHSPLLSDLLSILKLDTFRNRISAILTIGIKLQMIMCVLPSRIYKTNHTFMSQTNNFNIVLLAHPISFWSVLRLAEQIIRGFYTAGQCFKVNLAKNNEMMKEVVQCILMQLMTVMNILKGLKKLAQLGIYTNLLYFLFFFSYSKSGQKFRVFMVARGDIHCVKRLGALG
ncbi:hypothetical protein PHYBLDRAFT_69353 [Phycomyces blakesleeanus NRRL 1555(-)]|uniref:Uncharacterized protein n=1 Tax=Phycomyces blakesleeanus (strain ATCC 8743b / DSM 1359 / FGSC 10004 / NBRC 33097 / NRRL 1555) TaxID=763407 RepID=A0A162NB00_PHYB8|nr:hypothetical protein PHYBLDRAFT_69353 [Phycomyces blakesleeanus NRRL 1555(-)]OAD67484.1 hypothetical protein PHYBLDRAFT_69353 [Phycomyces blakesleeanus NRRL 1555(-)]|eukprot:XP_018285524.1 hypothetical protein PHYBLDRAFT_69353 [Phycomyces blakesleeanus NRRL 1555(-)]